MTKHTPGPWKACCSDEFGGGNIRSDHHRDGTGALLLEAGPMFHDYTPDSAEEQANLRLAAAAPDLLAALQDLMAVEGEPGMAEELSAAWLQALDAIAKATDLA